MSIEHEKSVSVSCCDQPALTLLRNMLSIPMCNDDLSIFQLYRQFPGISALREKRTAQGKRRKTGNMAKIIMDDGFNPEFVETAFFDGVLEIPVITRPEKITVPEHMVPFTVRERSDAASSFVVFYEYDNTFGSILKDPDQYIADLKRFLGVVTLDNSVYVDSPLAVQIANVYRSRAIGHYLQRNGIYVVPNVRWGDERSYTTAVLPEKYAFLGLPKHGIYSVGTYGCCKTAEERHHLRHGLISMIEELEPEIVLIYGAMPDSIFHGLTSLTNFIQFPDWTTLKKGGDPNGNR